MLTRRTLLATPLAAMAQTAPNDPADLTLSAALALIRRRKLTPLELTDACLARITRLQPRLNAFITVVAEHARRRARELQPADAERQPLHGIPLALKDLYDTAGIATTAASAHWRNRAPLADSEVTRRLLAAGAVITGKANMDEFAYNFTSETSVFGAARNPWNTECSPGGSSGGSAIAVSTGMSLAAIGSDTGGSIRLPAAFCGITGYKPTYGIVPLDGAAPLAWSLDHAGPMTHTALDAALMHGVLSGKRVTLGDAKGIRIGLARAPYWEGLDPDWEGLDPEVDRALASAISTFQRTCRVVGDVRLPPLPLQPNSPLPLTYSTIIYAEAHAFHREMLARNPEFYHPGTRASIELGRGIDSATYIQARREMDRLRAAAAELFRNADLLLTPTAPGPAFRLGSNPSLVFLRNTAPWNLLGLPTISIPCGFTASGLPIGLQLTGRPHADTQVLSAAAAFQAATDFHTRRPPL